MSEEFERLLNEVMSENEDEYAAMGDVGVETAD